MAMLVTAIGTGMAQSPPGFAQDAETRVLVFSRTEGFRHAAIPDGISAIQDLGRSHGFAVETTESPEAFTDTNLGRFDVVMFLLTTGDVLDRPGQQALERFVRAGGGFMGVHSAADTEYDWPFYGDMVGAYFRDHTRVIPATVLVPDRVHPSTEHLPARWQRTDEWYNFRSNPRGKVHVLTSLDETSYEANRKMGSDHPLSWCRDFQGGRTWYTGMGHTPESYHDDLFKGHLLGGILWTAGVGPGDCTGTVWNQYQKVTVDRSTDDPLALDIAPDGRVFFTERKGALKIYDPSTLRTRTAARLDVFSGNEDGLLGVAIDPGFLANSWVYLFYSPKGIPEQRVSRFNLANGTLDLHSESILIRIPTQRERCCHSSGALRFGPDGLLYISVGDNTDPFSSDGYAPLDERPGRETFDAQRTSSNTNDLRGKILRVRPESDGTYSIPAGNLFPPGTAKTRPEIYVMGVRNPFRMSVDAVTGWLYVGDVGPDARAADPRRGPKGFDELNIVKGAVNLGWPHCLADNKPYRSYDPGTGASGSSFGCKAGPRNTSPNNTGLERLPPAKGAVIYYPYGSSTRFPGMGSGFRRAAFAGPVYRRPANAGPEALPRYLEGSALLMEWSRRFLRDVRFDDSGKLLSIDPFMPDVGFKRPIDMAVAPDGTLYLLEWGGVRFGGNPDSGLSRVVHVPPGSRYPEVVANANVTSGPVPLSVSFTSSADDADGHALTYRWDFDGDGTVDSTDVSPTHTYTEIGNHTAQVIVEDPTGRKTGAEIEIVAGNSRPEVTVSTPRNGTFFGWGKDIAVHAAVTDPEDGSTLAGGIDCADVVIQPKIGHADHSHPLAPAKGCSATVTTMPAGAHGKGDAHLFYLIEVSYRDRGSGAARSLRGTDEVLIQPRVKQAEHFERGARVGAARRGTRVRFRKDGSHIVFTPINLQGIQRLRFWAESVSPGTTLELRRGGPKGELLGRARASNGLFDVPVTRNPGRAIDLVIRARRAGGSGPLLDLDKVRFAAARNQVP
jgi:glucose/arabinose dehydrogenase/type 1 glutamine amidotransferase